MAQVGNEGRSRVELWKSRLLAGCLTALVYSRATEGDELEKLLESGERKSLLLEGLG